MFENTNLKKIARPLADGVSDLTVSSLSKSPIFSLKFRFSEFFDPLNFQSSEFFDFIQFIELTARTRGQPKGPDPQIGSHCRPVVAHWWSIYWPELPNKRLFSDPGGLQKSTKFRTLSKSAPGGVTIEPWPLLGRLGHILYTFGVHFGGRFWLLF